MSASQSFDFQTEYTRHNATVVMNPALHPGSTVTISVKPILSVNSTVDFVVPETFTVAQFHSLIEQTLSDDAIFSGISNPPGGNYTFELVTVAQPPAPYNRYIWLNNPDEWEHRTASEFAPSIIAECQYPMGYYAGESFYLRFVTYAQEPLEQSVIDLTGDNDDFANEPLVPYNMEYDIENNADYAMTIDELNVFPNSV